MPKLKHRKVSQERFLEALQGTMGIQTVIARKLGVNRSTVISYLANDPVLQEAFQQEKESALDLAESKLLQGINEGDPECIRFYLRTVGKNRGYSERVENQLSGANGAPLVIPTITIQPVRMNTETATENNEEDQRQ